MNKINASLQISNDKRSLNNNIFNEEFDINFSVYKTLKYFFKEKGINLNTPDIYGYRNIDFSIFVNLPYPWDLKSWFLILRSKKNILFVHEPFFINPFNFLSPCYHFFKLILSINEKKYNNNKFIYMIPAQSNYCINTPIVPYDQKKFLCMIAAYKKIIPIMYWSKLLYKELYSKRISIINYLENNSYEFDLYGKGWNKYIYLKNYKGVVADKEKISTLSKYKFTICFENISSKGFITEKIFDCFKAKTIPIYFGDPEITKRIPENLFIPFNKFNSYCELFDFLNSMSEEVYCGYIYRINNFINSKDTQLKYFEEGFAENFLELINEV